MKNFPVNVNGKEYWVSRSIATVTYVFGLINNEYCILANKRGPGLPNKVGLWNCVSGYLDYDETLEEAAVREVFEETGVRLDKSFLIMDNIDSSVDRERQNVLVRYYTYIGELAEQVVLTNENAEPNEVDEVKWIPITEIDKYQWVSETHRNKIVEYYIRLV